MNCLGCEEKLSDYLENALHAGERRAVDLHLQVCGDCRRLLAGMSEIIQWGRDFPVHSAPAWLATRILANTPRVERETWLDTLAALGRWILEPRTALSVFTATVVIGWMGNVAGISPRWSAVVEDPAAIYYDAGAFLNRAYDRAVRTYHNAPLVTEIQSRIEQLRETS
jgi:anti-sigma factor RsiW